MPDISQKNIDDGIKDGQGDGRNPSDRAAAKQRLLTDAFGYTGAVVLSRIPPFVFLPIFAVVLGPTQLGRYLTAMILVDLVQTLSGVGMVQALFRFFPQAKGLEARKDMFGTALVAGLTGASLIGLLFAGLFLAPGIRNSLEAFRDFGTTVFFLALAAGALIGLNSILTAYIWAEKRPSSYFAAFAAGAAVETGLSVAMFAAHGVRMERILAIECVKDCAVALALAFAARRDLALRFSPQTFTTLFRFGAWLMPMGLFAWMFLSIDRFWLGQMAGMAEVGVYGFFYKFASPAAIFFQSYVISLDSHLFNGDAEQGRNLVMTSLKRYLRTGGLILAAAALVFPAAVFAAARFWKVLPTAYLPGLKVYPLLLTTTYVYFWAMHYGSMLEFELRSKRQLAYMSIAALANFALCPAFIALGKSLGLDPMASVAFSNLASAAGLLFLQSQGSSLPAAWTLWKKFLPVLASMAALFLIWRHLG